MTAEIKDEDFNELAAQNITNTAVNIAGHVNAYVHKECQKKLNHGVYNPFLLEDMTFAYACAIAKFSLYKVLTPEKRPTWDEMLSDAIEALKVAFEHVQIEIDKADKPCQMQSH